MDGQKDKKSLLEIAESVDNLVVDPAKMKRFRKQDKVFYEVYQARKEEYETYCQTILRHRKIAETNPRLLNHADGKPPHKGWVWEKNFLPDRSWRGFWRPPVEEPQPHLLDLLSRNDVYRDQHIARLMEFFFPKTEKQEFTDAEKLQADCVLLTIIHDKVLRGPTTPKINNGIWPEGKEGSWDETVWQEVSTKFDIPEMQTDINLIFNRVEFYLTKEPAEVGGNATPAKIINIGNFKGVLGDVQAENVQTGDYSSIHKQPTTAEKKKGILIRLLKIVGAIIVGIIGSLIAAILIRYFW